MFNVTKNFTDPEKESVKMMELLRRVYNVIEMQHLNDNKLIPNYCEGVKFPRNLGNDIFNYLQVKDETFRKTTIKRQKNYRKNKRV